MTEVIMPKMGDGMEEGTLLEWLKKQGDAVKSGEVIGTIQTDKAIVELEAPAAGTLDGFLIAAGDTVPVGARIAAILKEGEKLLDDWRTGSGKSAPTADVLPAEVAEVAVPGIEADVADELAAPVRVKASPLARRIAAESGIDLAAVSGSGPGGRIVERDVREAKPKSAAPTMAEVVPAAPAPSGEDLVVNLPRLRQITAKRTTDSKLQVPHFYVTVEVDVERLMALRAQFETEESGKVSVNDFVIKACALSLRDMPEVNAVFSNATTITQLANVHIGMAVAVPDGLTVPVIKNADQLSLRQISSKARELAGKARENKLGLDELTGSTFSISNMGMLNVDNFLAIINQPNGGILAIASARKKVVVSDEDELEIRWRMNITGSFDHRVLDGAAGAKFVNQVRGYLENPTRLLG
jgi:pyruvate dehydrogenase E2 component (dihydrolipoamide acetyltransferase)